MKMTKALDQLQLRIGEWGDRTFPSHHDPDGTPNPRGPFWHLADPKKGEIWELWSAIATHDEERTAEELADCAILLLTIAHLTGVDLESAILAKQSLNEQRRWGPPDENGVCLHT